MIRKVTNISRMMDICILVFKEDLDPNFKDKLSGRKSYWVLIKDNNSNMMPHSVNMNENSEIGLIRPETFLKDTSLYCEDGLATT